MALESEVSENSDESSQYDGGTVSIYTLKQFIKQE